MRTFAPIFLMLLILTPGAVQADICDDISDVADGWNAIADALEMTADEDIEDLDLDRLRRDVDDLLPGTETLGEYLVEEGSRREENLGNNLLGAIEDLYDVETDDYAAYMVDRIDDIVDTLDDTVDHCDAVVDE